MILGNVCTRNCRFCAVGQGPLSPPDPAEPERVASVASQLNLRHVVVTSVTRDDLPDQGAGHFVATINAIRARSDPTIEVLTPDFSGDFNLLDVVLSAQPEVFNHNIETVPRLYSEIRPQAEYTRSLNVLNHAATFQSRVLVKSGLMVGLGETESEVLDVLHDLKAAGVSIVTIGQYLAPSRWHAPVKAYIPPEQFAIYEHAGKQLGLQQVFAGSLVRSSYLADKVYAEVK
jgi:lipoic acid synthetase